MSEYHALLAKVDAFQAQAEVAQAPWLTCKRGCDGCCRLRRTAWAVEINHLRTHIQTLAAERQAELRARRHDPPVVAGQRCVFLDADGSCAVYAARPIICRTHGPAVQTDRGTSWCHLNFVGLTEPEVAQVPGVLDLTRLNTLLSVVNTRYQAHHPGPARQPLDAALDEEKPI